MKHPTKQLFGAACISVCALFTSQAFSQTYTIVDEGDWGNSHSSYPPSNATDGDTAFASRWAAQFNTEANLWVDLGSAYTVDDVGVAWGRGNSRSYVFEVWARSGTSGTWTKIFDGESSGTTDQIEQYNVTDISARQVRIKVFSNSAGSNWADVTEFEVYGTSGPDGNNSGGGGSGGSSSSAISVPGLIEAEEFTDYNDTDSNNRGGDYRTTEGVDIQSCSDSGCGYNIGWMYTGEWLDYEIDVASGGNYEAQVRVASTNSSGQISIDIDGSQVSSNHSVASTGAWQNWRTDTIDLGYISAGTHTLRLNVESSSFNLNWINIVASSSSSGGGSGSTTTSVPGRIEAEDFNDYNDTSSGNEGPADYRSGTDVDLQSCTDSGCGYNVGWMVGNEWLEYEISVSSAGDYEADVRLATSQSGKSFSIDIDGSDVTGSVGVNNTGGWQNWATQTVSLGYLSSGTHTLRFNVNSGYFNLNWIEISEETGSSGGGGTGSGDFGLDPNADPWDNFNLAYWKLDTPAGESSSSDCDAQTTEPYEWNSFPSRSEPYFFTHTDGGMRFVSEIGGATTGGNCNSRTRSELREMLRGSDTSIDTTGSNGDYRNNWALGYQPSSHAGNSGESWGAREGKLSATLIVNQVTTTGSDSSAGRTVIGQIHAADDEPLRLNYKHRAGFTGGCIYAASEQRGGSDTNFVLVGSNTSCSSDPGSAGIALGELFSYEIENIGEDIIVTIRRGDRDGTIINSVTIDLNDINAGYDVSDDYMYFKAGAYTQNSINDGGTEGDGDIVTFYRLDVEH